MELTVGGVLTILLGGLVVGLIARLAVPGPQPLGCLGTVAIGIAGGVIGGFLGQAVLGEEPTMWLSLLFSVLGAVLLLLVLRALSGRRRW